MTHNLAHTSIGFKRIQHDLNEVSDRLIGLAATMPPAKWNQENSPNSPVYTSDGNLKFPIQYREWVYVTSGIDMSYSANASIDRSMFDNVFVNAEAYKAFVRTVNWPDTTRLYPAVRNARTNT